MFQWGVEVGIFVVGPCLTQGDEEDKVTGSEQTRL